MAQSKASKEKARKKLLSEGLNRHRHEGRTARRKSASRTV
jgi:hypothetical protein